MITQIIVIEKQILPLISYVAYMMTSHILLLLSTLQLQASFGLTQKDLPYGCAGQCQDEPQCQQPKKWDSPGTRGQEKEDIRMEVI